VRRSSIVARIDGDGARPDARRAPQHSYRSLAATGKTLIGAPSARIPRLTDVWGSRSLATVLPEREPSRARTQGTAYQAAVKQGQEALRQAFLDAAEGLLLSEGPAALTVRRIAAEVGCSTKVVYTTFGGKDGLSEALYLEGFERFLRLQLRVPARDDAVARIRGLAAAFREGALAEPAYYRVMYLQGIPGFVPNPEARARARRNFELARQTLEAGTASGQLRAVDPVEAALSLWVVAHGVLSLELAGYLDHEQAEVQYWAVTDAVIQSLLPDAA
jgi:AcrR family transcriptional regulator